jgi:hypothetical protein
VGQCLSQALLIVQLVALEVIVFKYELNCRRGSLFAIILLLPAI